MFAFHFHNNSIQQFHNSLHSQQMPSNAIVQYSSSSSHVINTYDVFVSFRGEDTRNNFTGFLFQALRRKGIHAFKDDQDLKKGESIAPELLQAIQASRLFIIVFSNNYASSIWCLRELAEIRNCAQTSARRIIPIFYDVDPSVVRKQSGCYDVSFAEHEYRFRENKVKMEEAKRWREALTEVANLSGWDIRNKPQYAQIEEIVQNITNILGPKISSLPKDELVGIESRVQELKDLLCCGSLNDVRVVGISGMGGIGKTSLAWTLYERICHQYDFHCFIDDVSKIYRDSSSLGLQKQLISQSLNEKNLEICNGFEGTCLVWSRLHNARALIVLDNVDQVEQLRMFTGNRDTLLRECLGEGSKIIIISRDEHILRTHGVDDVYQVQPLSWENAVQLFCRNALKVNYILSDYEKLARDVLSHAQGHPLAIEVIGSSLFGRSVSQWKSALARLKENKSKSIMDVLRISFDELDEGDKETFLDIACFYNGYEEIYVKEILSFRGFHPEYGMQVLVDKSLITNNYGRIYMHSLLMDLGRSIVREKSPKEPRKWSRLWDYQDFHNVMSHNQEIDNLEAIVVKNEEWMFGKTTMKADGLSNIRQLKLLKLENVNFSGSLNHLSNELGYLTWNKYPFKCLPPSFRPEKLVELKLRWSSIQRLWEGTKLLHNLKRLDLSYSKDLIEMPDVGEALNLERVDLEGCIKLQKINPSIGLLRRLAILNLKNCKELVSLPRSIFGLNCLEYLSISGCSKLYNNQLFDEPRNTEYLKKLYLIEAPINLRSTPSFIKEMLSWPSDLLYLRSQRDPVSCLLPSSPSHPCLRELDLSFCNLVQIPDAIGKLHCLEKLNLKGNNFTTLPNLKDLFKLYYLNLQHCKRLKYLPDLPSRTHLPSKVYMLPFPYSPSILGRLVEDDEDKAGLIIFNCPELVDRERCSSMSISWMIQIVQANHQYGSLTSTTIGPDVESIIPGSEIPQWFNNQFRSRLNLIEIKSSSVENDNDWIGVVCCVIFGRGNEMEMRYPRPYYPRPDNPIKKPPLDLRRDPTMELSDHMWLFYFSRKQFIEQRDWLGLRFSIPEMKKFRYAVYVKKYGYRWVYEQDLIL
ncbi:TMV resistance protein [Vigna angularis]|nr:TMV resistance protein [Vigna angularis]